MALSDYSTSVEKIAALKCALMDPDLVNYHAYGTTFTTTESIYFLSTPAGELKEGTFSFPYGSLDSGSMSMQSFGIPIRINSGRSFVIQWTGYSLSYIKDSDIVYSDPITKYQDRLAFLYEAETILSSDFTVGEYGALLTYSDSYYLGNTRVNGSRIFDKNHVIAFPVKKDDVVSYSYGNGYGTYINLPSDW